VNHADIQARLQRQWRCNEHKQLEQSNQEHALSAFIIASQLTSGSCRARSSGGACAPGSHAAPPEHWQPSGATAAAQTWWPPVRDSSWWHCSQGPGGFSLVPAQPKLSYYYFLLQWIPTGVAHPAGLVHHAWTHGCKLSTPSPLNWWASLRRISHQLSNLTQLIACA
jgi:hypothetical protein